MGIAINPSKKEFLSKIIGLELKPEQYALLEEVSDSASKEYNIEKIMDRMKEDWEPVVVELKAQKETGTFIMLGTSYVKKLKKNTVLFFFLHLITYSGFS